MDAHLSPEKFVNIALHMRIVKLYSLAASVMLWYDTILTFSEEVEKIWKREYTFITVLWTLNRYLPCFGSVVIQCAFLMDWPHDVCESYVMFPEVLRLIMLTVVDVIFILRIYAIYGGHRIILYSLCILLLTCSIIKIWAFTDGVPLKLPPGLTGCILGPREDPSKRFAFTWYCDLVFDTVVFIMTLSRTLVLHQKHRYGPATTIVTSLMRDGIVYFTVIFIANFVTVMLYVFAPPDLKAINASFSVQITNLMVSRLILNLRRPGTVRRVYSGRKDTAPPANKLVGILGNPVGWGWDSNTMSSDQTRSYP